MSTLPLIAMDFTVMTLRRIYLHRRRCTSRAAAVQEQSQAERTSLVPSTLRELALESDADRLARQQSPSVLRREERRKRQRSLEDIGAPPFHAVLEVRW